VTNINLLPVSAPEYHPQGVFCNKKSEVQHANPVLYRHKLGIALPSLE